MSIVNILSYSVNVIIIFTFTYIGGRVLSKKAISEMTAYEITGIIILSTIAAEPLVTKITSQALTGVAIVVILTIISSRLALVNKATKYLEHTPTVLVKSGKIDYKAIKSAGMSINMFYGLLRSKGYSKTEDLEYVILEPQGKISAFPKSQKRPVQPSDLGISTQYEGISLPIIIDGTVMKDCLQFAKLNETWLNEELQKQGIKDKAKVLLAELDSSGTLYITQKEGR